MAISTADDLDRERKERFPPQKTPFDGTLTERTTPFRITLVAPNHGNHNTVTFTTWVEVRVVNDLGNPLKNERCVLWAAEGDKRSGRTDEDGVIKFYDLPYLALGCANADLTRPALELPDILEEWPDAGIGNFPKPDDYRRLDRMVRFVPIETPRFEVKIDRLTEEQKFQHFYQQYTQHQSRYWSPPSSFHPGFDAGNKRWKWQHGAVCNEHANLFLSYWFNYNEHFTVRAPKTSISCLSHYDSSEQHFNTDIGLVPIRGYNEWLTEVPGGSPLSHRPLPTPPHWEKIWTCVNWIRISGKYFQGPDWTPTAAGQALLDSLGNFNVYAVSDIKKYGHGATAVDNQTPTLNDVKSWLKRHKDWLVDYKTRQAEPEPDDPDDSFTKGDHENQHYYDSRVNDLIDDLSDSYIWDVVWNLDDTERDKPLLKVVENHVTWDHHGGMLIKRAAGTSGAGAPTGPGDEIFQFTADGSTSSSAGQLIELKSFIDSNKRRKGLYLNIWSLNALRPGGYVPWPGVGPLVEDQQNIVNAPSRFLFWA